VKTAKAKIPSPGSYAHPRVTPPAVPPGNCPRRLTRTPTPFVKEIAKTTKSNRAKKKCEKKTFPAPQRILAKFTTRRCQMYLMGASLPDAYGGPSPGQIKTLPLSPLSFDNCG